RVYMRLQEIKEYFNTNKTKIVGKNIETIENAQFSMLTDLKYGVKYSDEEFKILQAFEQKIIELYERANGKGLKEETTIHPMQIENGKVKLYEGQICHRCKPNMDTLRGISVGGILASEWFGKEESANEGFLCAFASRISPKTGDVPTDTLIRSWHAINKAQCFLYFDEKNPLMQELSKVDFFEYEHQKSILTEEELNKKYSSGIRKLYDQIIEPMSPGGKNMHEKYEGHYKHTYGWLAIPGGIPPQLINGLQLSTDCEIMQGSEAEVKQRIEYLQTLYPNAIIFDQNQVVLSSPDQKKQNAEEQSNQK
ncbi:MAG: hypothetical protein IJS74_04055, partial [Clostridia bacterium]|nr:hypothetical protein [Clostridia bacterium]